MKLTDKQLQVMACDDNLIITGGPGSGKTTISIFKAAQIAENQLRPEQKILFLSFARPTVSRIIEAIDHEHNIAREQKARIVVDTYHAFFWRFLRTHGYLIGLPRRIELLTPPAEAIYLSKIRSDFGSDTKLSDTQRAEKKDAEKAERRRLAFEKGLVCFDLFAPLVGDLICRSKRISHIIANMYPVIILDEFQDTNAEQWRCVKGLGPHSRLIALADPDQRIYDFIGADPERINHFRDAFTPVELDFCDSNHRSKGTEIADFGNDILRGNFQKDNYVGVSVECFDSYARSAMTKLISTTYAARRRLVRSKKSNWSIAILVPTKKMTRLVSDSFRDPPAGMTPIRHNAVVELEAAILGSEIIAHILQADNDNHTDVFADLICNYYRGKGGDKPTKGALVEADRMSRAYEKWSNTIKAGNAPPQNNVFSACYSVYEVARAIEKTGNPDEDWREIRSTLECGNCKRLQEIGKEVRNIRLLERGAQLRENLTQDWRDNGSYANALAIVKQAFVQEHFATGTKPETGIVIMNMHKAKGKQFDEVILFEGWPRQKNKKIISNFDRFIWNNDRSEINDSSRQNFRVSVTRSRQQTTILTPRGDPCVLFL